MPRDRRGRRDGAAVARRADGLLRRGHPREAHPRDRQPRLGPSVGRQAGPEHGSGAPARADGRGTQPATTRRSRRSAPAPLAPSVPGHASSTRRCSASTRPAPLSLCSSRPSDAPRPTSSRRLGALLPTTRTPTTVRRRRPARPAPPKRSPPTRRPSRHSLGRRRHVPDDSVAGRCTRRPGWRVVRWLRSSWCADEPAPSPRRARRRSRDRERRVSLVVQRRGSRSTCARRSTTGRWISRDTVSDWIASRPTIRGVAAEAWPPRVTRRSEPAS